MMHYLNGREVDAYTFWIHYYRAEMRKARRWMQDSRAFYREEYGQKSYDRNKEKLQGVLAKQKNGGGCYVA